MAALAVPSAQSVRAHGRPGSAPVTGERAHPAASARDAAARGEIERLYALHHREIHAYLVRMMREPETAADMTQETFVKAWRAWGSLEDPANARAWLYRIAHRIALDELRRRRIVRFLPWAGESTGAAPSPERLVMEGELSPDLARALARIPARQRGALLLAEVHELTGLELAAALGVSHMAARALLTRARESLRRALAEERAAEERAAEAGASGAGSGGRSAGSGGRSAGSGGRARGAER